VFTNILFLMSAVLTVGGAFAVILTKNIMHACVYLLSSLLGVAGLYVTLGADFVAATQLVVYVGGIVILMVFAVLLTGGSDAQKENKFGLSKIPLMGNNKTYTIAWITAFVVFMTLIKIISNIIKYYKETEVSAYTATVEKIGMLLVTDHVLAFEISSVLLLGALVGAAVIARPRKRE